jgi:hypothetical protein
VLGIVGCHRRRPQEHLHLRGRIQQWPERSFELLHARRRRLQLLIRLGSARLRRNGAHGLRRARVARGVTVLLHRDLLLCERLERAPVLCGVRSALACGLVRAPRLPREPLLDVVALGARVREARGGAAEDFEPRAASASAARKSACAMRSLACVRSKPASSLSRAMDRRSSVFSESAVATRASSSSSCQRWSSASTSITGGTGPVRARAGRLCRWHEFRSTQEKRDITVRRLRGIAEVVRLQLTAQPRRIVPGVAQRVVEVPASAAMRRASPACSRSFAASARMCRSWSSSEIPATAPRTRSCSRWSALVDPSWSLSRSATLASARTDEASSVA